MAAISPVIGTAVAETFEEWLPDDPPLTTLFGAVGWRIAEAFDSFSAEEIERIFLQIEEGMSCGFEPLVTAVATGLLEAIVSATDRSDGLWERVLPALGDRSRSHVLAWREFQ